MTIDMTTAERFERPQAEPVLLRVAALAVGLAVCAYAAEAWVADSAYGFELSRRPLALALWAATWAVDWTEGFKVVVAVGASVTVMIDSARRLFGRRIAR